MDLDKGLKGNKGTERVKLREGKVTLKTCQKMSFETN